MSYTRLVCTVVMLTAACSTALVGEELPQWIWSPVHKHEEAPGGACHFRKTFQIEQPRSGNLEVAADDTFEVFVNGVRVVKGQDWEHFTTVDVSEQLRHGENSLAIRVVNTSPGAAGLAVRLSIQSEGSPQEISIVSDASWKTSIIALPRWKQQKFADSRWMDVQVLGPYGNTAPWITTPVSSAQLAAATSTTKPARYEQEAEPQIALVSGEEPGEVLPPPRPRRSRGPLLLKPLEKAFPWLNKNRARANQPGGAKPSGDRPRIFTRDSATADPTAVGQPQEIKMPRSNGGTVEPGRTRSPEIINPLAKPAAAQLQVGSAEQPARFQPQPGFDVEHVLGNEKTGSLITVTFNEFGQVLAGRENGPLLLIVDSDEDGDLDEVRVCCDQVTNCQGILALSGIVFVVAEGPDGTGLYRLTDEDQDGMLEQVTSLVKFEVTGKEHGPHGLVLGPDSTLYITVGNHAKLRGEFAKLSPRRNLYEGDLIPRYEDPGGHAQGIRSPGGFILRTDVNGKQRELFASGLRNAYDLAFNAEGQLFTYDSDMESDEGTNWYRPTRLYHVLPGSEFGWRSGWAKWPAYYQDAVPPIAETGRGSPTGMVFYQHHVYPKKYRNVVFLGDWSEGRILAGHLTRAGATYTATTEVFLSGTPLNVTDLDVGPDGALYFTTGGRGTQGGLFRVVWKGPAGKRPEGKEVGAAVQAPQVNSSWGRQEVAQIQRRLGGRWGNAINSTITNSALPAASRLQALQIAQWVGPIPSPELLLKLSADPQQEVRQLATYLLSSADEEQAPLRLLELLQDPDPAIRRVACESLVRSRKAVPFEYVEPLLSSEDRAVVWAARRLLAQDKPTDWRAAALASDDVRTFLNAAMTLMTATPNQERALAVANRAHELMQGYLSDEEFIDLLRVIELTILLGDFEADDIGELTNALADEFPANHVVMNRELVRILVRLNVTEILDRYLAHLDSGLPDAERIHVATHLRFLKVDWTTEQKLMLFKHLRQPRGAGNSVAGYLQNVARDLGQDLSSEEDALALKRGSEFPSLALASVLRLPEKLSLDQIKTLVNLDRSLSSKDEVTKRLSVAILAVLARDGGAVSMAYLRDVFDRTPERRMEVAIGLAEQPKENWDYLIRSLPLLEGPAARELLIKLRTVEKSPSEPEAYRQVIMTGLQLGEAGGGDAVRLLEHWQGYASTSDTPPWNQALAAWQRWFEQTHPESPVPRLEVTSVGSKWDYDSLLKQLDRGTLAEASLEHGRAVFVKASCAQCHRHGDLGEALGPELSTVGKRFLTKEIIDSLVYPSKTISDQYRAQTIVTSEGLSHTGIVGSGGQDELIVLQSDGSKVRIPREDIEDSKPSTVSAMPEGLLNTLTLQEIIDLVAFMKTPPTEMVSQKP